MLTLLNTAILTTFGDYRYTPVTLEHARWMVEEQPWQSAVGHAATAEVLSRLLGVNVPMNRVAYIQRPGDNALVFKLRDRLPEGTILTVEDIERIGYDFGLLTRSI